MDGSTDQKQAFLTISTNSAGLPDFADSLTFTNGICLPSVKFLKFIAARFGLSFLIRAIAPNEPFVLNFETTVTALYLPLPQRASREFGQALERGAVRTPPTAPTPAPKGQDGKQADDRTASSGNSDASGNPNGNARRGSGNQNNGSQPGGSQNQKGQKRDNPGQSGGKPGDQKSHAVNARPGGNLNQRQQALLRRAEEIPRKAAEQARDADGRNPASAGCVNSRPSLAYACRERTRTCCDTPS